MLTDLTLEKFKAFGPRVHATLAPITLIYGQNSSGKSSLLQALLLLRQSLRKADGLPFLNARGHSVDLGSVRALSYKHESSPIHLEIGFESKEKGIGATNVSGAQTVAMTFGSTELHEPGNEFLSRVRYLVGDEDGTTLNCGLRLDSRSPEELEKTFGGGFEDAFSLETKADARSLISFWRGRAETRKTKRAVPHGKEEPMRERTESEWLQFADLLQQAAADVGTGLPTRFTLPDEIYWPSEWFGYVRQNNRTLESITSNLIRALDETTYLGPLRSALSRHYVSSGTIHNTVGSLGENTPQLLNSNADAVAQVNRWFSVLGVPYVLDVRQLGDEITGGLLALQLHDQRTNTFVSPSDVGFGIGQLLPVLVEGLIGAGRTILVEQPEIHLHPRLQANLADFFIESAATGGGGRNNQWIIETHSEALMLRIQRRIREGKLSHKKVSVLFVTAGPNGSEVVDLRINEHGDFDVEWPGGFFEEAFDELFPVSDDIPF